MTVYLKNHVTLRNAKVCFMGLSWDQDIKCKKTGILQFSKHFIFLETQTSRWWFAMTASKMLSLEIIFVSFSKKQTLDNAVWNISDRRIIDSFWTKNKTILLIIEMPKKWKLYHLMILNKPNSLSNSNTDTISISIDNQYHLMYKLIFFSLLLIKRRNTSGIKKIIFSFTKISRSHIIFLPQ